MLDRSKSSYSRRSILKVAGAAGALAAVGSSVISAGAQDETPVAGGTLTFGSGAPVKAIISPLQTTGTGQNNLIEPVFLRLVYGKQWGEGLNPDPSINELELAVAETMEEIEPNRVWEFTIRENVLWHDGTPVTVDDVIFGIWLSLNKNSGAVNETPVVGIKGGAKLREEGAAVGDISVEGATKIGDRGLRIELEAPIANYWVNWSVGYWPYPKHIFGDMPFEDLWTHSTATAPIGNGPFKLTNWVEGQYAEYTANEDFYLGRPLLDSFIIRFGDPDALSAALESGEIDGTTVSAGPVLDRISTLEGLVTNSVPATHPNGFVTNWERWPDHAAALNKAISKAIDLETLNSQLFSNTLRPSNYLFEHVVGLETLPEGHPTLSYDPDAARAILAEAGWDSNTELEWMMWSPPAAAQDAMQAMLAEVGIKVVYKQIDIATVTEQLYNQGNFDLAFGNFGPAQSQLDNWKYIKCGWFYTEGGFNYSRYCNEEVDALWQSALDETDWETAVPIWNEVSLALAETPAQATLYRSAVNYVWNDRVRGALPYQYRLPIRNPFERIWIAED